MAKRASKRVNGEGSVSTRPRADGLWVARYTVVVDGRMRRPVLYARTREEAATKLRAALAARDAGQLPTPARETVASYLLRWHDGRRAHLRTRSWERDGEIVRLHLVPTLGAIGLFRLGPVDVEKAYATLLHRGLSASTVRRVHTVLHRALGDAQRKRTLVANVADLVDAPRVPHREVAALSSDEARRLLEAARDFRLEALYALAVTAGLRRGEILALRWRDVDLEAGWLQVRGSLVRVARDAEHAGRCEVQEPKTTRSRRRVELTRVAVDALQRHRRRQSEERLAAGELWQDRDLVFTNLTGGFLNLNVLHDDFHELLRHAGLPSIRFHDLRHTAASLMLGRGVHPKIAADMLGHSTIAITLDLYSHVTPTMQRQATAALDEVFA